MDGLNSRSIVSTNLSLTREPVLKRNASVAKTQKKASVEPKEESVRPDIPSLLLQSVDKTLELQAVAERIKKRKAKKSTEAT